MSHGATGMSSISGNFYPEIMVWMVDHANDPDRQEDVKWIQQELTAADPLIHTAYPLCSKYFLQLRGLPIRTISRAVAVKLTPEQRNAFDALHVKFLGWCDRLGIRPVDLFSIK
jgi:4-hydroxy-tetrahydrodipicolinate synthase